MFQQNLLFIKDLSSGYLKTLELIFSVLPNPNSENTTGRPPHPVSAMLNALLFKNLRSISTLTDLVREINYYPAIAQVCGFRYSPSKERFSSLLKDTPNEFLQGIRENLVKELISLEEISTKFISTDSCPVKSPIRENNLKTNVKDRFDKTKTPKGDPEARLGVYVTYPSEKKAQFFWGYKNHIINDASSELPLAEITKPASVPEQHLAIPQLKYVKDTFASSIEAVIGDSQFDSSKIIEYIVKELEAKPVIAKNPRGGKNPDIKLSRTGIPICIAGFQMLSRGKYYDKAQNRRRHKFICSIKGSKRFSKKLGTFCPWNHPNFYNNRFGCTTNLRIDVDQSIRDSIDYGSQTFKKLYNLRTSSERIFSRLLTFCMQKPSVIGLNATANVCTIAHITVLAVALAAVKSNQKDKIRFIKRFIPNL